MPNLEKSGNLHVKSFFAASVPAAMEQARREFGADALLLNSRPAPPEARHLGEYEVVFGMWPETPVPAPAPAPAAPVPAPAEESAVPAPSTPTNSRRGESRHRGHPRAGQRPTAQASDAARRARSIERFARKRLAKTVLDFVRPGETPGSDAPPAPAVDEIAATFAVQPEIGPITALVGPPGSGKTTTLVKLAVTECLKQGRAVQLLSMDTVRIGGASQLRTYADILGVSFQAVESTAALAQAIESAPANTYVLIDTPGFSAALQQELGAELAAFLRHRQDIDTQLVLTASMAQSELQSTTDRFAAFNPAKLIFTRLDETTSTAAVVSEAARTRRPVSFLCNGQSVPEDILPASKDLILSSLVRQLPVSLQAVA